MVVRVVAIDSATAALGNFFTQIARVVAIAVGGVMLIRGETTVGTLVAFLGYLGGLFAPVLTLGAIYQGLRRASISIQEIFSILDMKDYMVDSPGATDLHEVKGEVVFNHVFF